MTDLFGRVLLPVASPEDARATCRALGRYLGDTSTRDIVAIHVVEKAGGAPDKAGVEQRQEYAAEVFETLRDCLGTDRKLETEIHYGTDVAETVFQAAADHDATAIVITPRGGSRWIRLLTGDVALDIVTDSDRPVVVLPDVGDGAEHTTESEETSNGGGGAA